jgi:MFS family permease
MQETITYRRLIRLPNVLALLAAICLARLGGRMFLVAIVFHALAAFDSPSLAGWISFAALAPGLLVSPLAGAFLDRAGAVRGVLVDLAMAATLMGVLAGGIAIHRASPTSLLILTALYSLTNPLSAAGVRVLLPRLVPAHALDKANALDTSIHGVVDVAGPSLAGVLVGFAHPAVVFLLIAVPFAAAALSAACLHQTSRSTRSSRTFLGQAIEGLLHVVRTPLLRGLAVGYALNNFTWGMLVVAVPVFMASRYPAGTWESAAGLLWAGAGLAGGLGSIAAGHARLIGREVKAMTVSMALTAVAVWPLAGSFGVAGLAIGLGFVGLLAGPIDVGLLTLRQRRTEPALLGRVLAVSMSINTTGFPIGSALAGALAVWSVSLVFVVAALASLAGAVATWVLIPMEDRV